MPRLPSKIDLDGAYPVFLLEVQWDGELYRFSSYPVDLATSSGDSVHYIGGLEDPDMEEVISDPGGDPEKNVLSLQLVFPVDLVQYLFEYGRTLDGALCELSMVTDRSGEILQVYEKRITLFSGEIVQPIIGDPEKPIGHVSFSIERNPLNHPVPIIDEDKGIFRSGISITTSRPLDGYFDGLAYPFVFGDPHDFVSETGFSVGTYILYATPAFIVFRKNDEGVSTPNRSYYDEFWLVIAGHQVEASTVTITDYKGKGKANCAVQTTITSEGKEISYVALQFATFSPPNNPTETDGIFHPWMLASVIEPDWDGKTDQPRYYVSWENGGGFKNPYGSGALSGAGDLIRYFLNLTNSLIDNSSWANVSTFLNAWKFGGYIDDPKTKAFGWLVDNVLPFVPVHIVNGANGLRPVIPLIYLNDYKNPTLSITIGGSFQVSSPIQFTNDPDDIMNRLYLNYGYDLKNDSSRGFIKISHTNDSGRFGAIISSVEIAALSYSKYGDRYHELEAPFVYESATATKIALFLIRKNALAKIQLDIEADFSYGWLQLGDLLQLSSVDYYWYNLQAQIIGKIWDGGIWRFTLEIENNVIINPRSRS